MCVSGSVLAPGCGHGQRQGGTALVEEPAAARIRVLRIGAVDGTAEVDPADQGELVLVAQRRDLDELAVRSLVRAGHRFRRRHDAAGVIDVHPLAVTVVAPVDDVLLVVVIERRAWDVLVAEAVEPLAVHLPDQRAAPRLERRRILDQAGVGPGQVLPQLAEARPGDVPRGKARTW